MPNVDSHTPLVNSAPQQQPEHDRQITIALAGQAYNKTWKNRTWSLSAWRARLEHCERGTKEGSCFLQGKLYEDGPRGDELMSTIEQLCFDLDSGQHIDSIKSKLEQMPVELWAYPSYNHETTTTKVNAGLVSSWAKLPSGAKPSAEQVIAYLREKKGIEPWVLEGAFVDPDGSNFLVYHQPSPRYRVVVPLSRPIVVAELGDDTRAIKQRFEAVCKMVARYIGIRHPDPSCKDLARASYTHRRRAGAESWFLRIEGPLLNLDLLIEKAKAEPITQDKKATAEPAAHDQKQDGAHTARKYVTPGLARWFATRGDGFRADDFLEEHGEDPERKDAGEVQCVCPNEAAHTDGADGRRVLWGVRASASRGGRYSISCRHDTCKSSLITTNYIDMILQRKNLGVEALAKFCDAPAPDAVSPDDFVAYRPMHNYIFTPTGGMWPASSVNAALSEIGKLKASVWLDYHRHVEQMTWLPGEPQLIEGRLAAHGGWIERKGCATFNLYRPPTIGQGDPDKAMPWRAHLGRIYPSDFRHIEQWLAHRVQRPAEKINHALVLGGHPGIGKDTLLEAAKYAVGPWNFEEISPTALLGRFNGFVKSVILRVSEARDLGDVNRYAFYERSKVYLAAPPDVITVDEKHVREYAVANCCGVVLTTNYRSGGLYLPADDRRHFVAWSEARKEEFDPGYWNSLWDWYEGGGLAHVAAYLAKLGLSGFDPKAPPPRTEAFWTMVNSERSEEEDELADLLDRLGRPEAFTLEQLRAGSGYGVLFSFLTDRQTKRRVPHRLADAGYTPVQCPTARVDGRWVMRDGSKQTIYARVDLPEGTRKNAAAAVANKRTEA